MRKDYICVEGQQGGRSVGRSVGRQVSGESRGRKFILLESRTDWMMTATIGQRPRQRDAAADGRGKKKERAEMDPPNEVWTDERTGERSEGADGQIDWGYRNLV